MIVHNMYGSSDNQSRGSANATQWDRAQDDDCRRHMNQELGVYRQLNPFAPRPFEKTAIDVRFATYKVVVEGNLVDAWRCNLKDLRRADKQFADKPEGELLHRIRTYRVFAARNETVGIRTLRATVARQLSSLDLDALDKYELEKLMRLTK